MADIEARHEEGCPAGVSSGRFCSCALIRALADRDKEIARLKEGDERFVQQWHEAQDEAQRAVKARHAAERERDALRAALITTRDDLTFRSVDDARATIDKALRARAALGEA